MQTRPTMTPAPTTTTPAIRTKPKPTTTTPALITKPTPTGCGDYTNEFICCDGTLNSRGTNDACCGTVAYNTRVAICCKSQLSLKGSSINACCGATAYSTNVNMCCDGRLGLKEIHNACCGTVPYNNEILICCDGVLRKDNC